MGEEQTSNLSGRGKTIFWKNLTGKKDVTWGTSNFILSNNMIDDILNNYFKDTKTWYKLGSNEDDPIIGGLGEYIQINYPLLTPRHASAIAAIMVYYNFLEFKGKKPIKLRKIIQ